MKSARFCLRPLAPWATPWQADTLLGALCWELVRSTGEDALSRLLHRFRQGPPPFLLSDAFPADLLPRPLCAVPEGDAGAAAEANEWQSARWLTREQFVAVRQGQRYPPALPRQHWWITLRPTRATVPRTVLLPSRLQLKSTPGSPRSRRRNASCHSMSAPRRSGWSGWARYCARWGAPGSESAARSVAAPSSCLDRPKPCEWLEPLPFENAFVSLSHFVPDESDPADGWWETLVKYPRLGSERAATSVPFKGRLVMLRPGSCFRSPGRPRRWYGRVLAGLSPAFPDALHYGLAYGIGIRWDPPR